jgi:methionine-R-sulfoxide reductase
MVACGQKAERQDAQTTVAASAGVDSNGYNKLTSEQEAVIVHKGTERPYSGEYVKDMGEGLYVCARCNEPLYTSKTKFDGHCGWPSFDEEIKGKVKRLPDLDGMRTEIECVKCGAHLGHVFLGEGFTAKNTRHCVNSVSLKFIPAAEVKSKS